MAGATDHYGLSTLGTGDTWSADGYKYTDGDRQTIDTLLYLAGEGHHHNGTAGTVVEPDTAPNLELNTTGGTIPAGTRVYYKYTYVNALGQETIASPESYVDTAAPVAAPGAPTPTYTTTGGVLQGGNYYYVLSSYVDASISESKALSPAFITIPATTATNEVTLDLPSIPAGVNGFNVYRRAPGQTKYFHLDTIDLDVATPPTTYVDDGSVAEDCDRTLPRFNTTNSTSSIDVSLSGATPTVPADCTWKIYRTYVASAWDSSFLVHVVENVTEGDPEITPTYLDVGLSTTNGTYPAVSLIISSPEPVDLGTEVQGSLPMGLTAFPFIVTFGYPGGLVVTEGAAVWSCEFPSAEIIYCRASLGIGSAPASTDVIIDVNKHQMNLATPTSGTIYTTQGDRPAVAVGEQVGDPTPPNVNTLVRGDLLSIDLDQVGGGATPTDSDLTLSIYMIAYGYPNTSFAPAAAGVNFAAGF